MKTTSLILAFLMSTVTLFASNNETEEGKGYLQGQVFVNDETTSAPYAQIIFEGTDITATANADGTFKLTNIPEGEYAITVVVKDSEPVSLGIIDIKIERPYNLKCLVLY